MRPLANHGGLPRMSLNHRRVCEALQVQGQFGNPMGDVANHAIGFVEGYDE